MASKDVKNISDLVWIVVLIFSMVIIGAVSYLIYLNYSEVDNTEIDPGTSISSSETANFKLVDRMEEMEDCIRSDKAATEKEEYIINSQSEFDKLLLFKSESEICKDFVLPAVNFSNSTVLGKFTSAGGCSVGFHRDFELDDVKKLATYTINVNEEGACEVLQINMNWVVVKRFPADYEVKFVVE